MSEQLPAGVFDPSKPYSGPDPSMGPPPITSPPANPLATEGKSPAPTVWGGRGSGVSGVAYMLDSVLKGAMQGYQAKQEKVAYQANRLMQGYQYAYKNAADQYLGMIQTKPGLAGKLSQLQTGKGEDGKPLTPD